MKKLKLEINVSHFVITLYDKALDQITRDFLSPYWSYKFEYNKNIRRAIRVKDKPFFVNYLDEDNHEVYRLHKSLLKPYLGYIGANGKISSDTVELVNNTKTKHGEYANIEFNNAKYIMRDYQDDIIKRVLGNEARLSMINLPTGYGKLCRNGTKVKIPNGWKNIEDIQIGDLVMGSNGEYTNVIGVYPQGVKDIWAVKFSDGRSLDVGMEHLWTVLSPDLEGNFHRKAVDYKPAVVDTRFLSEYFNTLRKNPANATSRMYIPLVQPEKGTHKDFIIHPYILGVLLGDGGISGKDVNIHCSDKGVIKHVENLLDPNYCIKVYRDKSTCPKYTIKRIIKNTDATNIYKQELKRLGLMGTKSYTKFIPDEYMNASLEQKRELIRGLMDTDGYVDKSIGRNGSGVRTDGTICVGVIQIALSNERLIKQIQEIVWSFGDMARLSVKYPFYTYKGERLPGKPSYKLGIRSKTPKAYFTRESKRGERLQETTQYSETLKLRITDVEYKCQAEATCIAVDSPDHLYVAEQYIVTHNTSVSFKTMSLLNRKIGMFLLPKYIEKAVEDIEEHYPKIKGKYLVIQGGDALRDLMLNADEYRKKYDVFIFSIRTITNYLSVYDNRKGDMFLLKEYPIAPENLMRALGISIFLNDESHQEPVNVSKMMLYFDCDYYILLTATFSSNDPHTVKMYKVMVPEHLRFGLDTTMDKYITINNIRYYIEKAPKLKHQTNQGYSQILYEQSLLARPYLLAQYDKMIIKYINRDYINRKKKGQKCLVYAATVDMCKHLCNTLRREYPDLKISTYVQEDDYENIMTSDICFSTSLSASTGLNIFGLICIIQTISMGSLQANRQMVGRLRKIPDTELIYDALYCGNLRKHKDLYKQREACTKDIAKEWRYETYRPNAWESELKLR
jgi:PHIKZ075|nr:MAG TPA: Cas system-associated protein [Caudoviricetes sp.]